MHTSGFQIRNENFFVRSRKSRDYAETYDSTPHKESRRLTPRLRKKAISGWKPVNYRSGGIVFVQINPGHIGNLTRDQIQKSYKKEHAQAIAFKKVDTSMRLQALQEEFQKDASLRNLHDLRDETYTAMRDVWGWPPGKYGKIIESHGVDLDSVAVVNLAQCPIPADRYTNRFLSMCWDQWSCRLIEILSPSILIAQGKTAYGFLEKQDLPAEIKLLEGVHHASRMSGEGKERIYHGVYFGLRNPSLHTGQQ